MKIAKGVVFIPNKRFQIPDEEIALRIVKLYFEEIARVGFKRNLTLDSILNAYFYSLHKLKNKDKEMKKISKLIEEGLVKEAKSETNE